MNSRDQDFKNEVFDDLNLNFNNAVEKVKNKNDAGKPAKLVGDAIEKIKAIDLTHKKVNSKEVQNKTKEVVKEGIKILGYNGLSFILKQTINWLEKINTDADSLNEIDANNKKDILQSIEDIQKLSDRASKKLKE